MLTSSFPKKMYLGVSMVGASLCSPILNAAPLTPCVMVVVPALGVNTPQVPWTRSHDACWMPNAELGGHPVHGVVSKHDTASLGEEEEDYPFAYRRAAADCIC